MSFKLLERGLICQEIPKGELDKIDWIRPCSPQIMNFEGETIITFFVDLLKEVKK